MHTHRHTHTHTHIKTLEDSFKGTGQVYSYCYFVAILQLLWDQRIASPAWVWKNKLHTAPWEKPWLHFSWVHTHFSCTLTAHIPTSWETAEWTTCFREKWSFPACLWLVLSHVVAGGSVPHPSEVNFAGNFPFLSPWLPRLCWKSLIWYLGNCHVWDSNDCS